VGYNGACTVVTYQSNNSKVIIHSTTKIAFSLLISELFTIKIIEYKIVTFSSTQSIAPLEHSGENCWNKCNTKQGKCRWCGTEGLCCNKGTIGNGCDGSFGGNNEFKCVVKPGTAFDKSAYYSIKHSKM
jgi:hypothetical protein